MINKEYVSTGQTKKSRKLIIDTFLTGSEVDGFMKETSQEATIYRALFVGTGINNQEYKRNVEKIINIFDSFIMGASTEKRALKELIDILTAAPIGMRRGIIPIYLGYAISKRNEDIIIYFNKKEVAITSDIVLNMCESPEDYYIYISLEDIKKEKYIADLCSMFQIQNNQKLTDSRIANIFESMQRWFRSLPQVTKNIKKQDEYFTDKKVAKAFPKLKAMLQNIEANPYEAIFVELPRFFDTLDDFEVVIIRLAELKTKLNGYFEWMAELVVEETKKIFYEKSNDELYHMLHEWYEKQSNIAKQGLHSTRINGLMSCISDNKSYDEVELVKRVVKATTEVYLDSWNDKSLLLYIDTLKEVKEEIENISDEQIKNGKSKLVFFNEAGEESLLYYEKVDENTGSILRNIIEDSLEDFSDLTVNDKVAILIEMIKKISR